MTTAYDFAPYLAALPDNYYDDDPLLAAIVRKHAAGAGGAEDALRETGRLAAGPWAAWADAVDRPDTLPFITSRDAYGSVTETVQLPEGTRRFMAEAYRALGPWTKGDEHLRFAKTYLLAQNGEGGVTCSISCTDGLVRLLSQKGDDERSRKLLADFVDPPGGGFLHGAQFVTEMQAGSDAAVCRTIATPDGEGMWRLTGEKWFCSNLTADYWVLTAHPEGALDGAAGVGLFLVPRLDENGRPNGHRVERLKDKLGTRALPTGEIAFDGARGWAVGPLEKGLANMVGIVLTTSRVYTSIGSAALLRGARRHVEAYTRFRTAFGRPIAELPVPAATLQRIAEASDRLTAGCWEVLARWLDSQAPDRNRETRLDARLLIMLMKPAATRAANHWIHEAMLLMGGNGIEERFSPLPRLYRDSAIYETWEGPHNLLHAQCLSDMLRFDVARNPGGWTGRVLGDTPGVRELGEELGQVLARGDDPSGPLRFADWAGRFYAAFEDAALAKIS